MGGDFSDLPHAGNSSVFEPGVDKECGAPSLFDQFSITACGPFSSFF